MKSIKIIGLVSVISFFIFSSFKTTGISDNISLVDAELVMAGVKVKIVGENEFSFTLATGNFYNQVNGINYFVNQNIKEKAFNRDVFINNVPAMYSYVDSTYKMTDGSFDDSTNFTWQFTDLTDTNNIIQYTTTKPMTKVNQFDLSSINSITRSNGFVFSHSLIQADSIMYVIGTDSLSSIKRMVYNQSYGVNFSSTELDQLTSDNNGTFIMLVFNNMTQIYNGKRYSFQNNSSVIVLSLPVN